MTADLLALLRERITLGEKLQAALDSLLAPTPTGYLHHMEPWTIAFVRVGEYGVEIEVGVEPPRGAYEWRHPSIERMQELQRSLGCDRLYVRALDEGVVWYVAAYNHTEPT